MRKPKKDLKLNITREASDRIRASFVDILSEYVNDCKRFDLPEVDYFAAEYQLSKFLSKYIGKETDSSDVRARRAVVKWLDVEQRNKRTNNRLMATDPIFSGKSGHQILLMAARLIERTIGSSPPDDLLSLGQFSSGATTSTKRGVDTLARRFEGVKDTTPDAWKHVSDVLPREGVWTLYDPGLHQPRFVKGNVLFTVPKTSIIDRVACKEPDWNVFAQKSVGDHIRGRLLKKARINLNDQSINRILAYEASIRGHLATIDLSSASDSLSTVLVMLLLPKKWFDLLSDLRCAKTFIDGASHVNEMFSSMGNGFTFELESLIFWAVAQTINRVTSTFGKVSVFGDDLIVPTASAGMLIQFLHWIGFKTNADKTFVKGPFRESCGGHYYRGLDVTPFYLKSDIKHVSDLILLLNQYRRWLISTEMDTVENGFSTKNKFVKFWYDLAAFVPKCLWGGWDLSSRVQLVSPGFQQCELLRTTRRWAELEMQRQVGMYLARLSELDRCSFPVRDRDVEFSTLVSNSRWVVRKTKFEPFVFGIAKPLFYIEQS